MKSRWSYLSLLLSVSCLPNGSRAADVNYTRDIKPVLKAKCYSCHGALKQEAGLRVDTVSLMRRGGDSGPALEVQDRLNSRIWQRVAAQDPDERMPPEGEPLSPEQLARFRTWLTDGAVGPPNEQPQSNPQTHWAFQPLSGVRPPPSDDAEAHPIDAFIAAQLRAKNVRIRRRPAAALTLIRRMFLDLHGLPPTPEQLKKWLPRLAGSDSDAAAKQLVDELLASPRYGERWAQHWLDVVRYADTHGYEVNTPRPNAWPYRDYVINAFNTDIPYDQFVTEQLVGDEANAPAATGFLVAAAALLPGQIGKDEASKRQARADELDEMIVGTSATFLGLTVGCARCHDHKFDPIPQRDYYAFQAFFAGVKYGDREIRDATFAKNVARADALQPRLEELRRKQAEFLPLAITAQTLIIDDEDLERVSILAQKKGHGANPAGKKRGYRDDVGDAKRVGNLSRGRYTWWASTPGKDVFTWNPAAAGRFRVWLSWGVHGSGVHTNDARYILDRDGNLTTKNDQQEIAQADQYRFVGVPDGETEKQPMWSGLLNAGVHELTAESKIVLRCGETGTGITADVIVLQESTDDSVPGVPRLRKPIDFARNIERFPATRAKFVRFRSFATVDDNKHQPCLDELEVFSTDPRRGNVALASQGTVPSSSGDYSTTGKHQLRHINDGRYGNSFSWISSEHGRGWVRLAFRQVETIDRIEWGRDREGRLKDRLPIDYRIETSLDGTHWTLVAGSFDREPLGTPHDETSALLRNNLDAGSTGLKNIVKQVRQLEAQDRKLRQPRRAFAGQFGPPQETHLLNRGDPEQPVETVAPHVLTSLADVPLPSDSPDVTRRKTLARWITSPDNPLTARVMVNRIWQHHFGTGLVETASDFGLNGARPSHPKLLDWLAGEFIANGWSVKQMHRIMMSSFVYRQAATIDADDIAQARAVDADNRLLWHFPARRLEAEAIRDCILQVSGQLNLDGGGPGFDFFKSRGGLSGFPPVTDFTAQQKKRMIYAHKIRMEPVPIFGAFDCPDAGLPAPKRSQSTTAIQALSLFNSKFVVDQAAEFANRVKQHVAVNVAESSDASRATDETTAAIRYAFRLACGRLPEPRELHAAANVVRQHGLPTLCRVLFNSNEFLFLP